MRELCCKSGGGSICVFIIVYMCIDVFVAVYVCL